MKMNPVNHSATNFGMAHKPQQLVEAMKRIPTGKKISAITEKLVQQSHRLDAQNRDVITLVTEYSTKKGKVIQDIIADVFDLKTGAYTENVIIQRVNAKRPDVSVNTYLRKIEQNIRAQERKISNNTNKVIHGLLKEVPKKPIGATARLGEAIEENTKNILTEAFRNLFGE